MSKKGRISYQSRWFSLMYLSHRRVKCRSGAPGHGITLKSVPKTTAMQGFILTAITATAK